MHMLFKTTLLALSHAAHAVLNLCRQRCYCISVRCAQHYLSLVLPYHVACDASGPIKLILHLALLSTQSRVHAPVFGLGSPGTRSSKPGQCHAAIDAASHCPCVLVMLLQLRRSFDALDQDHDGFITSADLLNLQQQLLGQHHMTKELAEDMMSEVSTCISDTHDGRMDFEEVRLVVWLWEAREDGVL